jgi:hypothetical protein
MPVRVRPRAPAQFSSASEAGQISPKLLGECGYYNSGEVFSMGLVGEGVRRRSHLDTTTSSGFSSA